MTVSNLIQTAFAPDHRLLKSTSIETQRTKPGCAAVARDRLHLNDLVDGESATRVEQDAISRLRFRIQAC